MALAGGLFRVLSGVNHVRGIVRERNHAPGNWVILVANSGPAVVLLVTLLSTGVL